MRHPNVVLTALFDRPKLENKVVKTEINEVRGLSSATITQERKEDRLIPLVCKVKLKY